MFIYVIGGVDGPQKIGFSNDVDTRLAALQTGNPTKLKIHYYAEVPEKQVRLIESEIHKANRHTRVSGEWFDITPDEAIAEVQYGVIRWCDD